MIAIVVVVVVAGDVIIAAPVVSIGKHLFVSSNRDCGRRVSRCSTCRLFSSKVGFEPAPFVLGLSAARSRSVMATADGRCSPRAAVLTAVVESVQGVVPVAAAVVAVIIEIIVRRSVRCVLAQAHLMAEQRNVHCLSSFSSWTRQVRKKAGISLFAVCVCFRCALFV